MTGALESLLADHHDAVHRFAARARSVPPDRWLEPRAPGKWTPAQETRHIILTYQACVADLRDGRRMEPRTRGIQRLVWRAIGLTSILHRRRIPRAFRAPREIRPSDERGARDDLLAALERAVHDFERAYAHAWRHQPEKTLAHPFFGPVSLRQAMVIVAVHTRHHAAFLPANGTV